MHTSSYKIYNASAGSGKTFTLAKSYLKILVRASSNNQFRSILALTFTNKAVGEMKERIINMLRLFSTKGMFSRPHPMFIDICDELSISPEQLHNKSKQVLKHITHNYAAFDISTIDGFNHRIVRTFAHDLKLPVNFEVELDQERLLQESVDRLISRAGSNKVLTDILVDFALEKADNDKSWDISYDFNKISKLLVNEGDSLAVSTFKPKSLEEFKTLKIQLSKNILELESSIAKNAEKTLGLIKESGLNYDDFNRSSLPKHFEKLKDKNFNLQFNTTWQNDLIDGNTLYPKRVSDVIASTIESIQPKLTDSFITTKSLLFKAKLKKGLYKNITPLSVLNAIQNELNFLKEEQNKILISEFNKIISKEIRNQPTPFIYERLGEKFKHYFIDEFQDTSTLQWENLVPLLENALSTSDGSVMLVGDAKQAIYRWRGGEAEQFINLYNKTTIPFQIEADVLTLDTNYRSSKEIINFNNSFFNFLGDTYFSDANYANLFKMSTQKTFNEDQGFVNLSFLDLQKDDDSNILYASQVLDTIKQSQVKGFDLKDICVLIRKRKEGVVIANYLSENGITITSSETLLLKNSYKIIFIKAFLKLLIQPTNDNLKIEVLYYLSDYFMIKDKHQFFKTHLNSSLNDMFKSLKSLNLNINKAKLLQLPLYELIEHIVRLFKLNETSDAYIQFFLDIVYEFTQKQNSDLGAFITYFEKKEDSLSVVTPENMDAVKIMTIHKSKGLEFPIVIFPFADLNIYRELEPKVWYPVDKNEFNGFKTLLLNFNKDIEHFGDIGNSIYNKHQSQLELDNINLLYVVLTRAIDQLYIISKKDISAKGVVNENTYSGMFISYLKHIEKWSANQLSYSFGVLSNKIQINKKEETIETLMSISTAKEDHNLSIITRAGLMWNTKQEKAIERGNLVHLVLSKIKTLKDIANVFNLLSFSGSVKKDDLKELLSVVVSVTAHSKLNPYFKNGFKIYNERDIITDSGQLLRPDRININSKNEVVIIDYKTGEQKTQYQAQLNAYEAVLNQMKFKVTSKLIVYINDSIDVIEV